MCTPCKHDIMSTITAYECPSLKYCMHCCGISGPSVWSASFKNSKDHTKNKIALIGSYGCHKTGKTPLSLSILGHHELHQLKLSAFVITSIDIPYIRRPIYVYDHFHVNHGVGTFPFRLMSFVNLFRHL